MQRYLCPCNFYLIKAIHILKPEEVDSAIKDNLKLTKSSQRCKEVLSSYKDVTVRKAKSKEDIIIIF